MEPSTDLSRLKALSTEELRAELASSLGGWAKQLLYCAAVWAELELRGEDLSDLRSGLGFYLPLIASGAVIPEVVVKFAGQPTILRAVAALPVADQTRLANGSPVEVAEKIGDTYTHRKLPVAALPARLIRLVFGERTIRTIPEQIAILSVSPTAPKTGKPPRRGPLKADRDKGIIFLGRTAIQPADLIAALGDLQSQSPEVAEEETMTVVVKLTAAEHQCLKDRANKGNSTQQAIVRNALRAMGLI
jgi:hypothetical protein